MYIVWIMYAFKLQLIIIYKCLRFLWAEGSCTVALRYSAIYWFTIICLSKLKTLQYNRALINCTYLSEIIFLYIKIIFCFVIWNYIICTVHSKKLKICEYLYIYRKCTMSMYLYQISKLYYPWMLLYIVINGIPIVALIHDKVIPFIV